MPDISLAGPLVHAVGLALLQFVWQGAAIGLITAAVLAALRTATPHVRYFVACTSLLAMAAMPVGTAAALARVGAQDLRPAPRTTAVAVREAGEPARAGHLISESAGWPERIDAALPAITVGWGLIVLGLAARLMGHWIAVERIRRRAAAAPAPDDVLAVTGRIARHFGIRRPVAVVRSARVDVPTVIGWLRPAILVPASALLQLPPSALEAIMAHELAHVRRHDYLVNAFQHLAETLFFYHPAIWWISGRIRVEREHCCDDLAVTVVGSAVGYARALATLEESRIGAFTLAATGGALLPRIQRLLGARTRIRQRPPLVLPVCLAVLAATALLQGRLSASAPAALSAAVAPQIESMPPARTEQVILGLEEQLRLAKANGDRDALSRLLNAHFVGTNQDGTVVNRDQALASAGRGRTAIALGLTDVTFINDTAVVTGTQVESRNGPLRFTRVWAIDGGRWTLISNSQFRDPRATASLVEQESVSVTAARSGSEVAAPPPPPPPPPGAGLVQGSAGGLTPPRKIRDVSPVYPEAAREANVQGLVIISAKIDAGGNVVEARVLRSVPMLDQAALDAVRQWKYAPALVNGAPAPVMLMITVSFSPTPHRP
jgi:TonB family protein